MVAKLWKKRVISILALLTALVLWSSWTIASAQEGAGEAKTYNLEILNTPNVGEKKGTLLFVHGVCHGAWAWSNFMAYFSERGYDCYALSLRGHGNSEGLEDLDSFSLDDYVQDVIQALTPFNGDAIVVGHSMGGGIAQKLICEYPGYAKAAVLFASIPPVGMDEQVLAYMQEVSPEGVAALAKQLGKEQLTLEEVAQISFFGGRIPADEVEAYAKNLQYESNTAIGELYLQISENQEKVEIPVGVIGSSDDYIFGDRELRLTADAFGTEAVVLKNLCHDMMVDPEWELAAAAVLDFLNQLPAK